MATLAVQIVYRAYLNDPRVSPLRLEFVVLATRDVNEACAVAAKLARQRELEDVEIAYGAATLEFVGIGSVRQVELPSPSSPILVGWVDDGPIDWRLGPNARTAGFEGDFVDGQEPPDVVPLFDAPCQLDAS